MDEDLSRAVRHAFVQLYSEGLIYRGRYVVNWCPRCETAVSDLEVVHRETEGTLYRIRYDVPGVAEGAVVATTRPETMLGDTALAIHPEDPRTAALRGKPAIVPLVGREVPVIEDPILVDREFGTGIVKVTPAHDANDFASGQRHGLPAARRHRLEREDDGRGRRVRGARPFRGAPPGPRAARGGEPPRRHREARLQRRPLPALRHRHRAVPVGAVVREDPAPGRSRDPRGRGRVGALRPRVVVEDLLRVDAQHPRLVHLAPALVGPSDPGIHVPERPRDRRRRGPGGLPDLRPLSARPGPGRARYLVFVAALAVLRLRLAREDRGPRGLLSDGRPGHRLRHPLLLGGADDHGRPALHREGALPHRAPSRPRAHRRREDVEDEGQRHRSARGDRRVRRRRGALHARVGRLVRPDGLGGARPHGRLAQLRDEGLERRALHARAARRPSGGRGPRPEDALAAGPVDPLAARRGGGRRPRAASRRSGSTRPPNGSRPSSGTSSATGTSRW